MEARVISKWKIQSQNIPSPFFIKNRNTHIQYTTKTGQIYTFLFTQVVYHQTDGVVSFYAFDFKLVFFAYYVRV